ncbi:lachesin-like [Tachypleus tridentatus]|uniref:lachesin-like n=1 Tax=Tachypleus tridentatus TaxID=6853 RepID=UPI003FD2D03A
MLGTRRGRYCDNGLDNISTGTQLHKTQLRPVVIDNIRLAFPNFPAGGNKLAAWIKVESKAILSIHDHVITRNYRISLNHVDNRNFVLQINDVKDSDRGGYMCQVNTAPMMSQVGYLDVVFPPEIQRENTSSDMITKEGSNVTLTCVAKGYPTPNITWRREDSQPIVPLSIERQLGSAPNQVIERLNLFRVSRSHIGAYLCIAMNGVPPSVSQRMLLQIYFQPEVKITNGKIGAHLGATALLSCHIEALPFPEIAWDRNDDTKISSGMKYEIDVAIKEYKIQSVLRIRNLEPFDFGKYKCVATNSLGRTEGRLYLYEIPWPTLAPTSVVISMSSTSQGTNSWNDMPNLNELEHTHSPEKLPQAAKESSSLYDEASNARGSKV